MVVRYVHMKSRRVVEAKAASRRKYLLKVVRGKMLLYCFCLQTHVLERSYLGMLSVGFPGYSMLIMVLF